MVRTVWQFPMAALAMFALFLSAAGSQLQAQENNSKYFTDKNGVAIEGYDVVAYFTSNSATKGSARYSTEFDGATWYFSSKENKESFSKDPAKYLPKYGGWCAYAVGAKNTKFGTDAKTFKLYNGELYLFYNGEHGNTSVPWNLDEQSLKKEADKNWRAMSHKG